MSTTLRNIMALSLLVLLAVSAFVAGYFTNDFVEQQTTLPDLNNEPENFGVFWEAWGRLSGNFLGDVPDERQLTYGAIRGVVSELNDPYTIFIEPVAREQERESLRGIFGGIGAYVRRPEDGGPIVLEPIPGNPAEIAGIKVDDILLAVDGVEVTAEMTVADVADMIKGEKGTTVTLTVLHVGSPDSVDIEVMRDDILIPSVIYRTLENGTIGYIQLTRFTGESSTEVTEAITDLNNQGIESLILDLRNNGGGLRNAAVDIADMFLADGPILYQQSKDEGERVFEATSETLLPDLPMTILINRGSASASEILAGALQDRERATIIGESSFGKGSVQLVFDLSDGSSVHVTSARWFTPNRQPIDSQGVQPDIPVEVTQEAIENGRDEILGSAVEFLKGGG